jgi:hypothetical protein
MRRTATRRRTSEAEIEAIADKLADIVRVLQDADPHRAGPAAHPEPANTRQRDALHCEAAQAL